MEEYLLLGVALLTSGTALVGAVIWNETAGKARRRRRIERKHFKSKERDPAR